MEVPRIKKDIMNDKSHVKRVIAVVSGKGGVGKSFVTSLLACALNKKAYNVGIIDGDIVGPSIAKGFNIHQVAMGDENKLIFPAVTTSGIKIISSNMMIEKEDDPIIWRGALVSSLLVQFYKDVLWGDLDYLLIDMPPGTSDVTLTAFQSIPLDGVVIVTTPQDLVSLIVKKAVKMAKFMNIPILGIVENMSYVVCDKCGNKVYLYGKSKLETLAKELDLKVLGSLPLVTSDAELVDSGRVEMIEMPEIYKTVEVIEEMEKKND
jgi:Mrp family chromosome partitioning ATPase